VNLYLHRAASPQPLSGTWQRRLLSRELYSEDLGAELCARSDLTADSIATLTSMHTGRPSAALVASPSLTASQMNAIAATEQGQEHLAVLVQRGGLSDRTLARLRYTATHPELLLALATSSRTPVDEQRRLLIELLRVAPASTLMYEPMDLQLSAFVQRFAWSYNLLLENCRDVMQASLIVQLGTGASSGAVRHICGLVLNELGEAPPPEQREDRLALTHLCVDICHAFSQSPGLSGTATELLCLTAEALSVRLSELGWSSRLVSAPVRKCDEIIAQYSQPANKDLLRRVTSEDIRELTSTLSEICRLSDHPTAKILALQVLLNPATTAELAAKISVRFLMFPIEKFQRWVPYPTPLAEALLGSWEMTNSHHAAAIMVDSEHPGEVLRSYVATRECGHSICTSILNKVARKPQAQEVVDTLAELITTEAFEAFDERWVPAELWSQLVEQVCDRVAAALGDSEDAWHTMKVLGVTMAGRPVVHVAELAGRVGTHLPQHSL
jgi:hypothetical protein